MRFAVAASTLFAGFAAAAPAVTETLHSTAVQTIISCGPEVTNCPGKSTSAPPAVYTSVPAMSTSAPVVPVQNTTAPAQQPSTVMLYSTHEVTVTSCAATVTDCPARSTVVSSTLIATGSTVVPVNVDVPTSAPYGMNNSTMPAYGPTGTAASTGFVPATTSMPPAYTGAAGKLNAGMALAGIAGFAAFLI